MGFSVVAEGVVVQSESSVVDAALCADVLREEHWGGVAVKAEEGVGVFVVDVVDGDAVEESGVRGRNPPVQQRQTEEVGVVQDLRAVDGVGLEVRQDADGREPPFWIREVLGRQRGDALEEGAADGCRVVRSTNFALDFGERRIVGAPHVFFEPGAVGRRAGLQARGRRRRRVQFQAASGELDEPLAPRCRFDRQLLVVVASKDDGDAAEENGPIAHEGSQSVVHLADEGGADERDLVDDERREVRQLDARLIDEALPKVVEG